MAEVVLENSEPGLVLPLKFEKKQE